jgi:hypothetical protein
MSLTPPPAAVFSWFQVDKSKVSNSSLKIRSPLQMVAGALVPIAVVADGTHCAAAAAIVQTNITRDRMLRYLSLKMFSIVHTTRCLLYITAIFMMQRICRKSITCFSKFIYVSKISCNYGRHMPHKMVHWSRD